MIEDKVLCALENMDEPAEPQQEALYTLVQAYFAEQKKHRKTVQGEVFVNGKDFINQHFKTPWEVLEKMSDEYFPNDNFVIINEKTQLESCNLLFGLVDIDKFADFLMDNETQLNEQYPKEMNMFQQEYQKTMCGLALVK